MIKKGKITLIAITVLLIAVFLFGFISKLFSFDNSNNQPNDLDSVVDDVLGGSTLYNSKGELIGSEYIAVNSWHFYDGSYKKVFVPQQLEGNEIVSDSADPCFVKTSNTDIELKNYSYVTISFDISSINNNGKNVKIMANQFGLSGTLSGTNEKQLISDKNFTVEAADSNHYYFNLSYNNKICLTAVDHAKITYVIRVENSGKISGLDYLVESDMLVFVNDEFVGYEDNFNINNLQTIFGVYANHFVFYHNGQSSFGFGNVITNVFPRGYDGSIKSLFDSYLTGENPDIKDCSDVKYIG